jgi:hypothetical protein
MASIVVHAGMPKAGSSSIQAWLARTASSLADHGRLVTVAADSPIGVQVTPYRAGPLASGAFLYAYLAFPESRTLLDRTVTQLDALAQDHDWVILSSEGLANLFTPGDERFLRALDELATRHRVHVAYYVRAQDASLEAAWRQWGFRTGRAPSQYLAEWADTLDYESTRSTVQQLAPAIDFDVRPLDPAGRSGASLIHDFARTFLAWEVEDLAEEMAWENHGLPLDVVNILRWAPTGLLWDSPHDNRRLDSVRSQLIGQAGPPSRQVERGRELLTAYCHQRFEAGNQRLIADLDWGLDHLVPPGGSDPRWADLAPGATGLDAFDELWAGPPPAEREAAYRSVVELATRAPG